MLYSLYYQATILRNKTWFFVAIMRSFENLLFDRAVDKEQGIFEFFIAPELEKYFLEIMSYFEATGVVTQLKKMPNRVQAGEKL